MSSVPTSHQIALAQTRRARRRRGIVRVKLLGGVFAAAVLVGIVCGVVSPGA